jgi:2-iminobutanoate/2-iminopropanoate deaminase
MPKQIIQTNNAPAAVGPYSQATIAGGFMFLAGQVPLVPETKMLIEGDIQAQTRQVLDNIKGIVEAVGASLDDVVKTSVFLMNLDDFAKMNEIYAQYFFHNPPARSTFQVAKLPLGANIEIEAIVKLPDAKG